MKIDTILIVSLIYIFLLFIVAMLSGYFSSKRRNIIYNPYVYSLTLGVYCTAWTYYGSVGRASTNGIEFLAIYIAPTLMVFSWWFLLRKIVTITERHNINNIADFASFRFGRSKRIGLIVAAVCLFGITPYISLQLKSINESIAILSDGHLNSMLPFYLDTSFYVSLFIGVLASIFGVRHLEEGRKHPGLVGVIAFESIVKLVILLVAGFYIVKLSGGFENIFNFLQQNSHREDLAKLMILDSNDNSYGKWFAMAIMSMFAVIFLPRQFQMAVVENDSPKYIKEAMYLFPLYLLLINIFVIPIALAGKMMLNGNYNADYTILYLLKMNNENLMMILVYLGGFAAATGMIIVSSVNLANMLVNNILVQIFIKKLMIIQFGRYITFIKRVSVVLIILLAYFFFHFVGESFQLVDLGLVSFAAISQIAPSLILGLFIRRINRCGVFFGILAGMIVWFWTLLIPYTVKSGLLPQSILTEGPFGISLLKPTELFGLSGLNQWSHTLFWSMFFNILFMVVLSMHREQDEEEKETAALCVESLKFHFLLGKDEVSRRLSILEVTNILTNFFGADYANRFINGYLKSIKKDKRELNNEDIENLVKDVKKQLSLAVGPSAAEIIINSYLEMSGRSGRNVLNIFKDLVSLGVGESRDTLIHRITELNILLEISRQFTSTTDLVGKLQYTLNVLKNNLKFDLVVIRKKTEDGLETITYAGDINSFKMISHIRKIDPEKTYIGKTVIYLRAYYIDDIDKVEQFENILELKNRGIKSFCHIPLVIDNNLEGVLSMFSKTYKNIFSEEFVNILESIANQLAFLINNHNKTEELIKIKEVSKELEIAKLIQSSLVSVDTVNLEGLEVVSSYSPSEYVGGDYYDIVKVDNDNVDIVIADVSGHSISSALIMSQIGSIIHTTLQIDKSITPGFMVNLISKQIFEQINKYNFIITMLYMRLNLKSGSLTATNAGHYPPVIIRNGEIIELKVGEILLGVIENYNYEEENFQVLDNDLLVLYTDGVIEAENENNEFFGKERFFKVLKDHAYMEPEKIKNAVMTSVANFTKNYIQTDDISLLIIKKQL
ncbi:SpoIIE family protein phosphatase [Calditerrivibrio sp.]|uniref:SpoIIE family protein phosphatase n=1 Tax=Calditerrivibrio sp. TaxID=2792612 RepID=UPI003D0F3D7C